MKMTDCSLLKLESQICFLLYAVSRKITQQYKPLLDQLDLTYPQYLVVMVLWETNDIPVKMLSEKLLLETNTLTPLLKRLEQKQIIDRNRSKEDERKVIISLTQKGIELQHKAQQIPHQLLEQLQCLDIDELEINNLKTTLNKFLKPTTIP